MADTSHNPLSAADLATRLASGRLQVAGGSASYAARLAALAAAQTPLVCVVSGDDAARALLEDLAFFVGRGAVSAGGSHDAVLLIAGDGSPYMPVASDREATARRLGTLYRLIAAPPRIVVLSASALLRKTVDRPLFSSRTRTLATGDALKRDALTRELVDAGYVRTPLVEAPGTFAVRGDVLDVFAPTARDPIRVEFFGDEVESLRYFDSETQRTLRLASTLELHPVRETLTTDPARLRARILEAADAASFPSSAAKKLLEQLDQGLAFIGAEALAPAFHDRLVPVWDYLPEDRAWLVVDPSGVRAAIATALERAETRYHERLADRQLAFPPAQHFISTTDFDELLRSRQRSLELGGLVIAESAAALASARVRLALDDNAELRRELERARRTDASALLHPLIEAVRAWHRAGAQTYLATGSVSRADKLEALLADHGLTVERLGENEAISERRTPGATPRPVIVPRGLSAGFFSHDDKLAIVTDDDLFGPRRKASARQRAASRKAKQALRGGSADFGELAPGDYVVHQLHGVGRYRGLTRLPIAATYIDFLNLEYDGGTLYLPVFRLGEVQRYVGAEGHVPRLDKLGGTTWERTRSKVSTQVRALAEDLLQLYAQRAALPGHRFPPPDAMFAEFEATFPFEETPDQHQAIESVLADMESEHAMDRLVCGDVGYGKTEVALRAMLKAVLGGKQAVLLAPTTILVEQHFRTMLERFAGLPINLARLSRFQTKAEQLATIEGLARGSIDVVVGTHRVLSKDIRLKSLGLLVIDEEQRFGVTHKERIKKMRANIDVLTLTATPIPRTLHLALAGLRDLSVIATPPTDRLSVRTILARADDSVLRDAITQELARGGQCFFVVPHIGGRAAPPPATTVEKGAKRGGKRKQRAAPVVRPDDRSVYEWADHLTALVPTASIAVAHGQLRPDALEDAMLAFVEGQADILVSTTIVESGLDIPRANTLFVARADLFGMAQLYQLRGRVGRANVRAYCYLLVPDGDKLTDDARQRLEALERYTDLGSGFHIASRDLEIRGGGELLGARQSGSIAAVGFDTYVRMLEEAVGELRGETVFELADPELTVETPGYIPDEYVPDPGQRLGLYKRLASAADDDELGELSDELADRYGPVPDEVRLLVELMSLKAIARRMGALALDVTSRRLTLTFGESSRLDPAKIAALLGDRGGPFKLTRDQRLTAELPTGSPTGEAARSLLLHLTNCVS